MDRCTTGGVPSRQRRLLRAQRVRLRYGNGSCSGRRSMRSSTGQGLNNRGLLFTKWQAGFGLLFATVIIALVLVPYTRATHCR